MPILERIQILFFITGLDVSKKKKKLSQNSKATKVLVQCLKCSNPGWLIPVPSVPARTVELPPDRASGLVTATAILEEEEEEA